MSKGEKSFEKAQAEVDREFEAARQELVDYFRAIKGERGYFTQYEAACLLVPTLPRLDELGRQVQRFEDDYQEVERLEARIEAAYSKDGENRLLPVNKTDPPDQWRYEPGTLLAWANFTGTGNRDIAREVIRPEEVEAAEGRRSKRHRQADRWSSQRERMFAAAVALLIAHPDKCKDKRGKITAKSVAVAVEEHAFLFFEEDEDPLAAGTVADQINQWLDKLRR